MQSASQPNLRSNHDKIGNEAASNTKLRFLSQEVNFHCEFREQVQVLHQLAKPSQELQTQILKLRRRINLASKDLQKQIIRIRRECTLLQIEDGLKFQSDIGQCYEQTANRLDARMQTIEQLVQRGEDYKKAAKTLQGNMNVAFKSYSDKQNIEEYINLRDRVKNQLKERLNLTARLIQVDKDISSNLLVNCQREGLKYSQYLLKYKYQKYYRCRSSQPRQSWVRPAFLEQDMGYVKKRRREPPRFSKSALHTLQDQLYRQSIDNLRFSNSKMQIVVQSLRNAITSFEDRKIGVLLEANSDLNIQQLITREIIAYRDMNKAMPDKLGACSFLWAKKYKIEQPKLKSNEWDEQTEQSSRISVFQKKRPKSDDKKDRKKTNSPKLWGEFQTQHLFHSNHIIP